MSCLAAALLSAFVSAQEPAATPAFRNGLPPERTYFPLAVWLQSPHNAARYRELGINLYVGLYGGPTTAQLAALEQAGMPVVCAQNDVGLAHTGKVIQGWLHGDEPDNAQSATIGYGPPIPPWQVVEAFERMRKADPTRPVLQNLGQGAAWDDWHGRGPRTNHPEDYPEYCKGCDIVSFDIYPVTHKHAAVRGKLEFVGRGVQRLRGWTQQQKPVWACIETTHVDNAAARPTPAQVRSEVWMAIACGASGVIYFAHEFAPKFVEAGLLAHPEIAAAVRATNAEVLAMAPILNGPTLRDAVRVEVEGGGEIAVLAKADGDDVVVFAASMTGKAVRATFTVQGDAQIQRVQVLGEQRDCAVEARTFRDPFDAYAIHHYRVVR